MSALEGHHAVITGGGSGIGLAVAQRLAVAGAAVTLMGRNREKLEQAAAGISGAENVALDINDLDAIPSAFEQAGRRAPVDILINNAGASESAPAHRTDVALWRRMLDVNLTGAFFCVQAALAGMRGAPYGRIVTIASTAGLKGYPYVAAYSAAKHGAVGFTRALAAELAGTAVTVNAVCPGFTETGLVEEALENIQAKTGRSRDEALAELTKHNPQGRLIQPEEVASAVEWLCRPESGSITGQAIAVDGGEVSR